MGILSNDFQTHVNFEKEQGFLTTIVPIILICISGLDEWFDFKDNILDEFKKL